MTRWLASVIGLLGSLGCGAEATSHVRLDLSPIWQAAGQRVDWVAVRVFDDQNQLLDETGLSSTDATADLYVLAGPQRRFEVEAASTVTDPPVPSLWGQKRADLVAGAEVSLVVPVFPAGGVTGSLIVDDGTLLPESLSVHVAAIGPRNDPDVTTAWDLPAVAAAFSGTVIDGEVELTVSFRSDTALLYSGTSRVTIVRDQIVEAGVIHLAP